MSSDNLLFCKGHLSDAMDAEDRKIRAKIDQETPDYICTVDEEKYIRHITEQFQIQPLELLKDEITVKAPYERETTILEYGETFRARRTFIEFSVPFTGDETLFLLRPNRHNMNPPREVVRKNEVAIEVQQTGDPNKVKTDFDQRLRKIQEYIEFQRPQIEKWNAELPSKIRSAFQLRKAKLIADNNVVAALGFPLKSSKETPGYSTNFRKKVEVQRPKAGKPAAVPHPFLREEHFQEILKALREMELVMERSPSTFHGLGEEAIRDHFLVALNGRFEGTASAETFNFKGKTDILLQQDNGNVFIAECKIWKGDKALAAAIDQLLGYLTWRNTKAALLIFVRDTKISTVLSKIPALLREHPSWVSDEPTGIESEFRAQMKHTTDDDIRIHVVVQVYHVPNLK